MSDVDNQSAVVWTPHPLNQSFALLFVQNRYARPTDLVLVQKLYAFEDALWSESVEVEWRDRQNAARAAGERLPERVFVRLYLDNTTEMESHAGLLSIDLVSRTFHLFNPRGREHQRLHYAAQHARVRQWLRASRSFWDLAPNEARHGGEGDGGGDDRTSVRHTSRRLCELRNDDHGPYGGAVQRTPGLCALWCLWWLREQLQTTSTGTHSTLPSDTRPFLCPDESLQQFYAEMMAFRDAMLRQWAFSDEQIRRMRHATLFPPGAAATMNVDEAMRTAKDTDNDLRRAAATVDHLLRAAPTPVTQFARAALYSISSPRFRGSTARATRRVRPKTQVAPTG